MTSCHALVIKWGDVSLLKMIILNHKTIKALYTGVAARF